MKQSYEKYCESIEKINFEEFNQTCIKITNQPLKQQNFQLEINVKNKKLKDSPWLNKKEPFDNRKNLYLKVIDLMKSFIRFQQKDFLKYAQFMTGLNHIANKIQSLRLHNPQFQILYYLMNKNNRKLISVYIKIRKQIITRCGLNTTKYKKIALHNQSKNFDDQNVQLAPIKIDYMDWAVLAELTKSKISQDMLWWISQGNRQINAIDYLRVCLWSHEINLQNPEQQ